MDIEKTMVVAAPIDRVWTLLLDPKIMAGCVPGVQSVEVLSDKDYLADIKVKISFISVNFKVKTTILETRPPHYLRCEGTGEDSSVASSLKQTSEMFLSERPDGQTEVRVKSKAEVFGQLGSFGLTVMKTKADRMWEEFSANFAAVARQGRQIEAGDVAAPQPLRETAHAQQTSASTASSPSVALSSEREPTRTKWWQRLAGPLRAGASGDVRELRLPTDVYIELHRGDDVIKILWPASAHADATAWLKSIIGKPSS